MAFNIEELFDSIKVIVTQELNNVSYDTTVIATIVDDSDKAKGHYVVSDGTIKFDAYTNDTEYKTGDQVRVTVINGDWSQRKFIEGKYVNESTTAAAATYIPPLGTTIAPGGSEFDIAGYSAQTSWTLLTNQSPEVVLFKQVIPADDKFYALQANGIYNTITISADVNTDLGQLKSGNYGLRLDLLITPELGSTSRIQRFMSFDSSEMLGNPYTFVIDTRQEKSIPIYSAGYVTEIVLSAYQGYTINSDGTTQAEPFKYMDDKDASGLPITFSNVHLGFGSDLSQITDNKLQLYTADSAIYQYDEGKGHSSNHKKMGLMWYNKTEDNQYIGFSDGIYDQSYDEITYLKDSYADSRLTEHLGKTSVAPDETSLRLAANIQDAEPLMKNAYTTLTTGLAQILQRFQKHLTGATTILEQLNPLILIHLEEDESGNQVSTSAKLVQAADEAKTAAMTLKENYLNVLQYGYNVSQGIEENEWSADWVAADNYTTFVTAINNGITLVEDFLTFTEQETATGKTLSGYRGFYNDYKPKIKSQLQIITNYLDQLKILKDDYAKLQGYAPTANPKHDYTAYVKSDFADRANKYCIYWYRYKEGYALSYITPVDEESWNAEPTEHADYAAYKAYCDKNNREYQFANFLGPNWERLEKKYDVAIDENGTVTISNEIDLINFGLPESYIEKDVEQEDGTTKKVKYWNANPVAEQLLSRWLDPCTETERYRVVMFYNHEQINSTILTFDNQNEVPPQYKTDAGDVLRIEHHTDSRDHYQAYSPACDLLNISDGSKSRQLKLFYDGVLSGDETLADAEVYWYIPVNSTMLTYDRQFLINKGFNTDDNYTTDEEGNEVKVTTPYSKDGYVYFSKKIGYDTTEEPMLDENGQQVYNSEGQPQTNEVITLTEADRYFFYRIKSFFEASAQNNTILVHAYVPNKEEPTVGEISFTFSTFGSNGTKYTLVMTPQTTQIAVLPNITKEDGSVTDGDLKLTLSLYNADGELQEMGTDMMSDTTFWNLQTSWHSKNTGALAMADADPIADSYQRTITIYNDGNNDGLGYDDNCYVGVAKAEVSLTEEIKNGADSRTITLSTLYPVSWASNPDFYISGPTMIVYNSQGTVSRLSEEPYCLYQHTLDGDIKVENQSWSLIYYKGEGESVPADELPYQPTLNKDNTLRPAPMYYHACDADGNEIDHKYVPVAVCRVDGNIAWTQPIIVSQNKYESSMLNAWDGSLEINEANGTIMSTMVGAGIKNQDNTFSGVLMGDIVAGADFDPSNANGIGIYGFHEGEQSFNFSVKGTAFLGKSGRGRIHFDGNHGSIYSANWLNSFEDGEDPFLTDTETGEVRLNNGRAGMAIDLEAGHIDAYDFKLTGSTLHFNSHPENYADIDGITGYYMRIGNDGITRVDPAELLISDEEYMLRKTPGLIAMDADGNLTIRVNSLYLTGNTGGTNLLRQTAPKKIVPVIQSWTTATDTEPAVPLYEKADGTIDYTWALKAWDYTGEPDDDHWPPEAAYLSLEAELRGMENDEAINGRHHGLKVYDNDYTISQTVDNINGGQDYTISGYVAGLTSTGTLTISIPGTTKSVHAITSQDKDYDPTQISYNKTSWTKFIYTFTTDEDITSLTVSLTGTNNYALWHLMLENGGTASDWSAAPDDVDENAENEQLNYDTYLTQDEIFKKLTTDPVNGEKMVGIWLLPGEDTASGHKELYINATYMSTGILRSSNWNGTLERVPITGKYDSYGNQLYTYELIQNANPVGVYFNLDAGKLWAATFELNAGKWGTTNFLGLYSVFNDGFKTISGIESDSWRIVAGDKFGVTKEGVLAASDAHITGNITATTLAVTESGTIGGWCIDTTSLYYAKEGIGGTKIAILDGTDGSITGAKIVGGQITITKENSETSFAVDLNGKLTAIGGEIQDLEVTTQLKTSGNLLVTGKAYIGSGTDTIDFSKQKEQLWVNGTTEFTDDVYISKGLYLNKDYNIYFYRDDITNSAYINSIGGKQLVCYATTGVWIKAAGEAYNAGGTAGAGISISAEQGAIVLNAKKNVEITSDANLFLLASKIGLGSNPVGSYKLTLPKAETIFIYHDNGTIGVEGTSVKGETLASYIERQSGISIGGTTNHYYEFKGTANSALGLTQTAGENVALTLKAPAAPTVSTDVTAQALVATKTDGTTEWRDIENNTKATYLYASDSLVTANTVYHALPKINDSHIYYSNTSIYAPESMGSNGQVLTTSITGGGTSQVTSFAWKDMSALIPTATASTYGTVKVHSVKTTAVTVNSATTTASRYYRVEMNNDGKLFVNVPWVNTTYTTATFAAADHNHDDVYSAIGHTHSGYLSTSGTAANAKAVTVHATAGSYLTSCNYSTSGLNGSDETDVWIRPTNIQRTVAETAHSSKYYKNTILDIDNSDILYQLRPVSYFYNKDRDMGDAKHYGFIAEEVEEFAPELVSIVYDENGNRDNVSLFYNSIIGLAVAEIQKLRKELDDLKSTLNID